MGDMRQASKENWIGNSSLENINAGSFQRIADACELMAKNNADLVRRAQYAKEDAERYKRYYRAEAHKNRALKGHITRLKKKLAVEVTGVPVSSNINPIII